jgi:hypothetical protein
MILGSSGTACTATAIGRDLLRRRRIACCPAPITSCSAASEGNPLFLSETVAVGDSLVVVGYGVTVRGDGRTGGTARAASLVVTGQPGSLQSDCSIRSAKD